MQIRCDHHKKRAKFLSEAYDDLANVHRRSEINSTHAVASRDKTIQDLNRRLDHASKQEAIAQKIIERAATIDFDRNEGGQYAITVTFNGDFMGGISRFGEPLEYIAERVARDIQREIATSRFVETAHQNQRRRMTSDMRLRSAMGPPGWGEGRGDGH